MKRLALVSSLLLAFAVSVDAWERDLHEGLTLWLALQAGFTQPEAVSISKGTQSEDEGAINPATWMMIHVLLSGDKQGSQTVSDKHFPTDGQIDSPPNQRRVVPNSAAARDRLTGYSGRDELDRLGRALHPFQDSWSHQGIPDTPLRPGLPVYPNLSWSHPEARGGWSSHNADITSVFPQDAMATARETYQVLVDFRDKHPNPNRKDALNWETLAPEVESFAKAATKADKKRWFETHLRTTGIDPAVLVRDIDIAGEVSGIERVVQIATLPQQLVASDVPRTVVERASSFLINLFKLQTVGTASEQLEATQLKAQFGGDVLRSEEDARKWGRKFMTSLLIADHGAVNAAGHAFPSAKGYDSLPEAPPESGEFRKIKTRLAGEFGAQSIGEINFPGVDRVYAVVLDFSDERNDSVAILLNSRGQVVRFLWTID